MQVAKAGGLPTPSYILVIKTLSALCPANSPGHGPGPRSPHTVGEHQAQRPGAGEPSAAEQNATQTKTWGATGQGALPQPSSPPSAVPPSPASAAPAPRPHTPRCLCKQSPILTPASQPGAAAAQLQDTNPTAPRSRADRQTATSAHTDSSQTLQPPALLTRHSRRCCDACAGAQCPVGAGGGERAAFPRYPAPGTEVLLCPPGPRSSAHRLPHTCRAQHAAFSGDPTGTLGPASRSPSPSAALASERLRTFYSAQLLPRCSRWAL